MTFEEAFESLKLKFTSSNVITVERAMILREEWEVIEQELVLLQATEIRYLNYIGGQND